MDLSEISTAIKATLYDRIKNPALGCFILSWLIINHRAVFVLFSEGDYAKKFAYIDSVLLGTQSAIDFAIKGGYEYPTNEWAHCLIWLGMWLLMSVILPALMTVAIIWFLPPIIIKAYDKSLQTTIALRNKRNEMEAVRLITEEERDKLFTSIFEDREKYNAAISRFDTDLNIAKAAAKEKDKEIKEKDTQIQSLLAELRKLQPIDEAKDALLKKQARDGIEKLRSIYNQPKESNANSTKHESNQAESVSLPSHQREKSEFFKKLMPHFNLTNAVLLNEDEMFKVDLSILLACVVHLGNSPTKKEIEKSFCMWAGVNQEYFDRVFDEAVNQNSLRKGDLNTYSIVDTAIDVNQMGLISRLRSEMSFTEN